MAQPAPASLAVPGATPTTTPRASTAPLDTPPASAASDTPPPPPPLKEPQGSEYIWKDGVHLPNVYFKPTLVDLLVPIMAANFKEYPLLGDIPTAIRGRIVAELALDLPLELCAPLIVEDDYWKRRASLQWRNCDKAAHGDSWKQLFFERNLDDALARFEYTSEREEDLRMLLEISAKYLHNIECCQLPSHLQLLIILDMIPNELSAVKLEYGCPNSCMDYDIMRYGMKRSDCVSMSAALSVTATLTDLNLSSNLLTDEKLDILCTGMAANPTVVSLDLSHNLISDAGCVALAKVIDAPNTVLMFLNLCKNKIAKVGTRTLGFSIRCNKVLLSLNLRHNDLSDYGGHRIYDYMMDNQTIQKLSMSSCGMNEDSVEALSKLLHLPQSALTALDASANPGIGPAGGQIVYTGLVAAKKIKQLDLKKCNIGAELEANIEKLLLARSFDEEDMLTSP